MGWLSNYQSKKKTVEEVKDYLSRAYVDSGEELVAISVHANSEVYLAIRKGERVFAYIILIENNAREFGEKAMSEDMLPYYFNAPKRLIKALSPTEDKNSNEWRETCLNRYRREQ